MQTYKEKVPQFDKRREESLMLLESCPEKVPIICEKDPSSRLPDGLHSKYLVRGDMQALEFCNSIRIKLRLNDKESLSFIVNDRYMLIGNSLMSEVYQKRRDPDGVLYIKYTGENIWGSD